MQSPDQLLTRKDVAQIVGVSPRSIAASEKFLGIDKAIVRFNARVVRYRPRMVMAALAKKGLLG